ncbi:MAG: thioredoxin domain-containing protein [Ignavibacteria bacterium]|nr:thioredoxin domain-containing protein [Ignavibacteria bacterium]
MNIRKPNKLISEKSPYLLQHAFNPVNWYPWGEEAFEEARKQNKPIFLSIGYSSCYWCHVMARESFENEEIANMMNNYFINIKVDREEYPEVDKIYMIALQSMLGYGGWPLNIFLNHSLKPFYGFTYLPPKAKYGRSGLEDVFNQVHNLWQTKQKDINDSADKIFQLLKNKTEHQRTSNEKVNYEKIIQECFESAKRYYDYEYGGFGTSNKFPRPSFLNFLLKYYYFYKDKEALDITTHTLKAMYNGGIFDHLEGGFHRYSVDRFWRVPHFEKMLYDQAQLIIIYIDAYKITNENLFLDVAIKTSEYVLKKLYSEEGGFFSSEDAESINDKGIKQEGYYYLWKFNDLENILNKEELKLFSYIYGIKYEGNTIPEYHHGFENFNVLYIDNDIFDAAKNFSLTTEDAIKILKSAKDKLIAERKKRIPPEVDTKIITSWNGMMINAIVELYKITSESKYLDTAERSVRFIFSKLYDLSENKLYHSYKDEVKINEGNLDDYAHLINALISLYQSTYKTEYLIKAQNLFKRTLELFYDDNSGGFWDTSKDKDNLILKIKDITDTSEPSSNSIMLELLIKMKIFDEEFSYDEKVTKSIESFINTIEDSPYSHPQIITVLLLLIKGGLEIIFSKDIKQDFLKESQTYLNKKFIPFYTTFLINEELINKYKVFENYNIEGNKIFLCKNFKCDKPLTHIDELKNSIEKI